MIERTFDYRIVNRLASWKVRITIECIYLIEKKGNDILGLWSFEKLTDGVRIHADMGPKCRGYNAIESAVNAFRWIFRNLPVDAIYAGIPAENKPACQVAVRAGMVYKGHEYKGLGEGAELCNKIRWFELRRS